MLQHLNHQPREGDRMSDLQNVSDPQNKTRALGRAGSRALAVAATVAAAAVVWVIGEPLLGHDLVVEQPGQPPLDLGLAAFVIITLGASLAGWAVLAVLERITRYGRRIWTGLAIAVVALSYLPFLQAEMSAGSAVVLAFVHLVVGAVLITLLRRTPRSSDES
jgi:hypothetical protein